MDLTDRFIQGLLNYNLTKEEIQSGKWKYCGGNLNRHRRYFSLFFKERDLPDYKSNCVCGHDIVENCYITDGDKIHVLGNCCIKKFLPKKCSGRTCRVCKNPHKNQKDNLCHNCRKKTSMRYYHMINTLKKHIRPALLWDKIMDVDYVYEEVDFNISRTYDSTILSELIKTFPPKLTLEEIVIKAIEYKANIIVKNNINVWELRYVDFPYEMIEKILINNEKKFKKVKSKTFLYKITV